MSVGNSSSHSSTQKVTSKYFSSNSGMDESLSDFQEKKQFAAPKTTKPKKTLKKPKGQKDIRTVLKSKKSELVAYSRDFDHVCKQSGIDVDSEQLQLAIALSKSIQPSTSELQASQPTSQERTARIRSTLQEYGFKVPEIKISNTNRRTKKEKKNYKLLLLSHTEKQQNIDDKFSQVLLQNICEPHSPKKRVECNNNPKLFYLSTNVSYETLRDNNLFYLKNLPLEKSSHKGSLLRDWSEIPGRPKSPKLCKEFTMDISEILCSQEELNICLSGVLKNAKNLINKIKLSQKSKDFEIIDVSEKSKEPNLVVTLNETQFPKEESPHNITSPSKVGSESARSCSPDIFDDEPSSFQDLEVNTKGYDPSVDVCHLSTNNSIILPSSSKTMQSSEGHLSQKYNITRRRSNDVMELTECVGLTQNPCSSVCLTMRTDVTKRKSNDLMELTECVMQDKVHIEDHIDLTQHSPKKTAEEKTIENTETMDLTQSSNSNDALPIIRVSGKINNSLDDTVNLNESEINVINRSPGNKDVLVKSTLAVSENKDLLCNLTSKAPPKTSTSIEESSSDSFFEDFMYNHSHSPEHNGTNKKTVYDLEKSKNEIDLIQSPEKNEKSVLEIENKDKTGIDLTQSPIRDDDTIDESVSDSDNKDNTEIDLTQNSSYSEEDNIDQVLADKVEICNKSSLGKKDNVSIDYDELTRSHASSSINKTNIYDLSDKYYQNSKDFENDCYSTNKSNTEDSSDRQSEKIDTSQTSQESVVFEISDRELDYSMHKSRYEDCSEVKFGGISMIDGNNSNKNIVPYTGDLSHVNIDKSKSDSFLPEVNVKKHELLMKPCRSGLSPIKSDDIVNNHANMSQVDYINHEIPKYSYPGLSPVKNSARFDIVKTPSNNEYVIKTDQVTPMADYTAMSTPDRNKELGKYGLKPLKRKRAIQLLTHIYNQTHPIMEPSTSKIQSPIKKRKIESTLQLTSPVKSPRKTSQTEDIDINKKLVPPTKRKSISPIRNVDINYEIKDNIYEVTNERVEIRNIECDGDELVFQKKEKVKLHSCRVPLHIAFHNYISCRQGLREAILRYEPIEIDVVHKDLVANGYRYDPKELLKFLDKKCITVKTADNNARNSRK